MQDTAQLDLVIDRLINEGLIGMSQAARLFGTFRAGRPTHPSTVSRYCISGTRLGDGTFVRLEHVRMPGGRLATSRPAILRYLACLQAGVPRAENPPVNSIRPKICRAVASAELDKLLG